MGLAPYGTPGSPQVAKWKEQILAELVDLREDGSFLLNMDYFNYATGLTMCVDAAWEKLFGLPRRESETALDQRYMNMALAIQEVTEEIVLKLAKTARDLTGSDYLVMAGGVALNCVANGKLLRSGLFKDLWIQPASGDAGGAVGAAFAGWHITLGKPRENARAGSHEGGAARPGIRRQGDSQGGPPLPGAVPRLRRFRCPVPGGRRADGRGAGGRLVPGAHGIRAAGAGQPQHRRRCPPSRRCRRSST